MLDWTLEDLAHRSGLTPRYLSTLENDKRDPSLSTIEAVAKALGSEPGDLFGSTKEIPPAGVEAAKLFVTLTREAQETVIRLMRLLARRRR